MFKKAKSGFTLVEIMIVVAIIGILVAIAVPGFMKARKQSQKNACIENMTKISGAAEQYMLEKNLDAIANIDVLVSNDYFSGDSAPTCPTDGAAYTFSVASGVVSVTCTNNATLAGYEHVLP